MPSSNRQESHLEDISMILLLRGSNNNFGFKLYMVTKMKIISIESSNKKEEWQVSPI